MATNIFKFATRPQSMARMQHIRCFQHQPTHYRSSIASDPEPEPEDKNKSKGSSVKSHLWDLVFQNDKRHTDFSKEFKDSDTAAHRRMSDIAIRMEANFSGVQTQFAEMKVQFAEMKTQFARIDGKITFIQWQLGFVGSAIIAFLGFAGYAIKKRMDVYIPEVAPSIRSAPTTEESKDASGGAGGKK
ncbi:hypothetical protein L873DRAFT_1803925 [Choiromyces venosus 120613-1]|uniref:Uncharacterized protein n=1 Tax=Choiromyces venosus 120613-1 TaxID=1336337 RepID=A0A3N4JVY4_9PEZI|nr:hypothetical protein L873DRAFT_1803925 [Choiromyces venosus 120613-1]